MKTMRRILSMFVALVMVLGLIAPTVYAADDQGTTSVVLHKILMTEDNLNATKEVDGKQVPVFPGYEGINGDKYNGNEIQNILGYFGAGSEAIDGVYFAWQNAQGKWINEQGKEVVDVKDALGGLTADGGKITFNTTNLPEGTYTIQEVVEKSTYTGKDGQSKLANSKAVPVQISLPVVGDNGTMPTVHVYPKNTENAPKIDKNFKYENDKAYKNAEGFDKAAEGAEAHVGAKYENYQKQKATVTETIGKKVPYEVKTQIPKNAKYQKLAWNDIMTKGLTFDKDLDIKLNNKALEAADYTLVQDDRGFSIKLTPAGLTKVQNEAAKAAAEIVLTYHATVNADAVVDIPEKNDIKLDWDNRQSQEKEPTEVTPKDNQIKVTKKWAIPGQNGVSEEADKNVVVVYNLQEKDGDTWKTVQQATVKYDETNGFDHTFTGLDANKTYRVVERVSGYEPEYVSKNDQGVVEITNKKQPNSPNTLNPTEPQVVVGGKKFVKTNFEDKTSDKLKRLAGAEFYVKNNKDEYLAIDNNKADDKTAYDNAQDKYMKAIADYNTNRAKEGVTDDTVTIQVDGKDVKGKTAIVTKIGELKSARDEAFKAYKTAYKWVAKADIAQALVFTSDDQGRFEVSGLAYGSYKLEEKTAPQGFAKLEPTDSQLEFTVAKGSYEGANTELQYNEANADNGYGQQIKDKDITIPQTGGIGTIIFTVLGLAIMGSAIIAIKKRQAAEAR